MYLSFVFRILPKGRTSHMRLNIASWGCCEILSNGLEIGGNLSHLMVPPLQPKFAVVLCGKFQLFDSHGCLRQRLCGSLYSSSAHCRDAANTIRRLLFMGHRSSSGLSQVASTPLYYAIRRTRWKQIPRRH